MTDKHTQLQTVGAIGLGAFLFNFVVSERDFHKERAESPVLEKLHVLPHEIFEPKDAKQPLPALVFLHGWPDDVAMLRPFAKHLSSRYRCVNCNLPGYPLPLNFDGNRGNLPKRTWGFTLDEGALALKNTILATCKDAPTVTLITHDWGAICGYLMHQQNPEGLIQRMVGLDVGWRVNGMTVPGFMGIFTYQAFLNLFQLMPSSVGSTFSHIEAVLLNRHNEPDAGPVTNDMNWPYRSAWRDMVTKGAITRMDSYVPRNLPMLFMYGRGLPKFIRFSDEQWNKNVEATCPGVSKVKEFPGSHWFLKAHQAKVLDTMDKWLVESESHMPKRTIFDFTTSGAKL